MSRRIWAVLLAGMVVSGATGPAVSAGFFEKNFYLSGPRYSANVPLCEDSGPLSDIRARFRTKESRFWTSDLTIVGFENVREVSFRPWTASAIPRRFCRGDVMVSDGVRAPGVLFDRRGRRPDRRHLWGRVVNRRPRPELVVQSGMQDGAALI